MYDSIWFGFKPPKGTAVPSLDDSSRLPCVPSTKVITSSSLLSWSRDFQPGCFLGPPKRPPNNPPPTPPAGAVFPVFFSSTHPSSV
ncbi:MAG: hypothetical protein ACK55Z_16445, partial [bacterium]